ncbi:SDR family NAD(P)-dependent oxidoreductase [Asanoa sp. WMMD1127]|uniref:SDR family NAD(P)-dependent oxidoreductase n=1 Tax=Asanoa sp. WMMD1127 TaxID=3016107 RepID=UPI00241738CC|nr:SDR family NAD(P)-dependent oxidoreductase [Asanoa sp. WMMD1127]MDG4822650.1 SDR family NAD(P)-dependent oxidoreductase [Asanoa sp. WMMD1127]
MEEVTGRVVVITGASSGIGLSAAVALASRGDQVVLVGRDPARLSAAAAEVRDATGTLPASFRADFAALDDVRTLAEQLRSAYDTIHVLANNAGAIVLHPATTVDGYELTIQANHLASFLLTVLLHDRIERMVVTASGAYRWGDLDPRDLNRPLERYFPLRAYGTSKQANILFAGEAARQWPGMLSFAFHPGVVRTRFYNDNRLIAWGMKRAPLLRSPERGAETLVWLATADPARLVNGAYYYDKKPRRAAAKATDPALAGALWKASEQAIS